MFPVLLVAGLLVSGCAMVPPHHEIRNVPGGIAGNAPTHVDDNDGGRPVVHRSEVNRYVATNGIGSLEAGDADRTVTYSTPARGTLGSRWSPVIVTNDDGRPQLRHSNW